MGNSRRMLLCQIDWTFVSAPSSIRRMNIPPVLAAAVLLSLAPAGPVCAQKPALQKAEAKSAVQTRAEKLMLNHIGFAKAGIQEAVDHILKLALKADEKEQRGVNILLHTGDEKVPHITMEMRNVSVWDALQAVAKTASLRVAFIGEIILLHTDATTPRERKVPGLTDSALWKALAGIKVDRSQFVDVPIEDVLNHFTEKASDTGKRLNLMHPISKTPLMVTLNTRKAALTSLLEATAELTGQEITTAGGILIMRPQAAPARPEPEGKKGKAVPEWMKSNTWKRAEGIIFDDILFIDAAVADVTEHLTKESKVHDKAHQGVTVSITGGEPRVLTLDLRKAKLSDIMLALAEAHGLEISVDENSISLKKAK
jgi:hypothetical protein